VRAGRRNPPPPVRRRESEPVEGERSRMNADALSMKGVQLIFPYMSKQAA